MMTATKPSRSSWMILAGIALLAFRPEPVHAQPELLELISGGLQLSGNVLNGAVDIGSDVIEHNRRREAARAARDSREALGRVNQLQQQLGAAEQARKQLESTLADRQKQLTDQERRLVAVTVRQAQTDWERINESASGSKEQRRRLISAMTFDGYRDPSLMRDETFRTLRSRAIEMYLQQFGSPELKELSRIAASAPAADRTQAALIVSQRVSQEIQYLQANPQGDFPEPAAGYAERLQRAVAVNLEANRLHQQLQQAQATLEKSPNPTVPTRAGQITSFGGAAKDYRTQRAAYVSAHGRVVDLERRLQALTPRIAESSGALRIGDSGTSASTSGTDAATPSSTAAEPAPSAQPTRWPRTVVATLVGGVTGAVAANLAFSGSKVVQETVRPGFFESLLGFLAKTQVRDRVVDKMVRVPPKGGILAACVVGGALVTGALIHYLSGPAVSEAGPSTAAPVTAAGSTATDPADGMDGLERAE